MLTALLAAAFMYATDIFGTCMVMFESAGKGWLAGGADLAGWYVSIFTTTISVNALDSHNTTEKVLVLALVGLANVLGTKQGQVIGSRLLKRWPSAPDPRIAALEARIAALEGR